VHPPPPPPHPNQHTGGTLGLEPLRTERVGAAPLPGCPPGGGALTGRRRRRGRRGRRGGRRAAPRPCPPPPGAGSRPGGWSGHGKQTVAESSKKKESQNLTIKGESGDRLTTCGMKACMHLRWVLPRSPPPSQPPRTGSPLSALSGMTSNACAGLGPAASAAVVASLPSAAGRPSRHSGRTAAQPSDPRGDRPRDGGGGSLLDVRTELPSPLPPPPLLPSLPPSGDWPPRRLGEESQKNSNQWVLVRQTRWAQKVQKGGQI